MLRVGFAFLRLRALAGSWSQILGVVRPGRDGSLILFRNSPPPLSRPDIVSDIQAVSPWSLALGVLSLFALEIILSLGHGFSSHLFLVERIAIACCPVIGLSHLNEFVLHSPFIIVPVAPELLSIREGDFLASVCPGCCVSSVPALQGSWALLAPVGSGSRPVHAPVLLDCRLPLGVQWAPSHEIPLLGYLPAGYSSPPRGPWP